MEKDGDWVVEGKDFITELKEGKYLWLSQHGINNVIKEIERLNNIINNTAVELEILLQSEDFELIIMQLRNIIFRLKGSDK